MPKKRKKAHSHKKRFERVAKAALKGQAVIFVGGWDGCKVASLKANPPRVYRPGPAVAASLGEIRAKWSVFCAVFCRDQNGQQYMKSISIHTDDEYYQEDLLETLNEHHQELVKSCNAPHVANFGWLASPAGDDISEALAGEVFDLADAWGQPARWQQVQDALEEIME